VAVGHSAGGHLALWLGARHRLPDDSPLKGDAPLALRGVVSLSGVGDLRTGAREKVCGDAIPRLLGGPPDEQPERLALSSPIELLPLGVPQHLVGGSLDGIVPPGLSRDYATAARQAGDEIEIDVVEGAGHFELVRPGSVAWPTVLGALKAVLEGPGSGS
jgi:pimeloyl-ACP methyl ester carboxylesterase